MNKHAKIGFVMYGFVFLVFVLISGCGSGDSKAKKDEATVDIAKDDAAIYNEIKQAEKIFNALPSPLESAMLIKSADARFDEKFLNPVENVSGYISNKSMALNLGIYTCDLSFASLYDQTQLIINYMNAAKKMADGLGILDAIDEATIERLEENINNKEVIMEIVGETFMNSNSYLQDNNQPAISAIVLVGGWMEGLYIATQLIDMKDFNGNKLVSRIIDQKLSIGILVNLLENSKGNPAVDELLVQVNQLKTIFDKISITAKPIQSEYDKTANVTLLKSEVKTDMTPEVFRELSTVVAQIRNSFVK
jgi:hypothetical protein